jgi:hypothetical protein
MNPRRRPLFGSWKLRAAYVVVSLAPLACPRQGPPPKGGGDGTTGSGVPVVVTGSTSSASADSSVPSETPTNGSFPLGAVKAPLLSDDACVKDADCAPITTCHPDRCVAVANVGTLPPGTMCTEMCMGGTLDCAYNHCGCAANKDGQKRCAVLPGPSPKK